jgi:zinc D-Ala-D-Ala carboxypeptidase
MKLTKNFSLSEFERSTVAKAKGFDNKIPEELIPRVKVLALNLQIVRSYIERRIQVTSGYRSQKLNKAVGGANGSHHMEAYAVDFVADGISIAMLFDVCKDLLLYDQLIHESKGNIEWIHLSIHPAMRMQAFEKQV